MWQCPKCRSKVDDSFEVCWSCGTTPDGIEDPNFVTADEADPIPDEEVPEGTDVDDPLADFAGTPLPILSNATWQAMPPRRSSSPTS